MNNWQRRWQPLLEQWVLISANSAHRPWSGATESDEQATLPEHDPDCYLCPGVTRANGKINPQYKGAFAFDNDFPSLGNNAPASSSNEDVLQTYAPAHGRCRVLCWSEKHNDTLASLSPQNMIAAVRLWRNEYVELSNDESIEQVLIFENKGVEIGVSNLHPHGQIYATSYVTDTGQRFRQSQADYARQHDGRILLQSMLQNPLVTSELIVEKNQHWTVIVPYAARFSFETWIIPNRHLRSLADATDDELAELALCYQRQVQRYDAVFQRSAPNITLLHNAPCDNHSDNEHWCFHIAFHPPLRDPTKLKYLAGFESGSNNIVNPLMPEHAAQALRSVEVRAA